jgi:isoleucyl-tRNA synthetase
MPYASNHYPFENKKVFNPKRFFGLAPKGFPADFIAEYIAQTRTWFYYMHAIGVSLFGSKAFKTVVSTGTVLAADGSKMSKSKGNYTDPLQVMDRFGADALRFYLMGSVVMQSEDLNFRDEEVREAHNRLIGILWNSYKFFELYKNEYKGVVTAVNSPHMLDRWVLSRLAEVVCEVTRAMDTYNTPAVCRALRNFVEDYSTWYVRRSRDRVRGDGGENKQYALAVQRHVLLTVSQLLAPITPFVAESIYRTLGEGESVHLSSWPEAGAVDEQLLKDMEQMRSLASVGLKLREKAGIKVRQPLRVLKARSLSGNVALHEVLKDEINVKEVVADKNLTEDVWLDTTLTPELKEEGMVRELARRVQEWRKKEGLKIEERPDCVLPVTEEEAEVAEKYREQIIKDTGLKSLTIEQES